MAMAAAGTRGELVAAGAGGFGLAFKPTRCGSAPPTARGDYDPPMLLGVGAVCLSTVDREAPPLLGTAIVETNFDDVDLYIDGEFVERWRTTGR